MRAEFFWEKSEVQHNVDRWLTHVSYMGNVNDLKIQTLKSNGDLIAVRPSWS